MEKSLYEIFDYLKLVWLCIRSADFTLNFKTVVERVAFDSTPITKNWKRNKLTDTYYETSNQIEKEILAKKQQIEDNSEIHFSAFEAKLVEEEELKLNNEVNAALDQPIRSK